MSTKSRTSLTLSEHALNVAKQRRESLGYASVSEYIEFLILEDAHQRRIHTVTRTDREVNYSALRDQRHEILRSLESAPKVAESAVDYGTSPILHDPPEDDGAGH
jgi:Arc/MetJ-type ribon-helix-helix transcriptional regulator